MPQKKILTITLIDGRVIERDLSNLPVPGVPIGAPANDPAYATMCQQISICGYTDIEKVNDKCYTHIAPSQIKTVSLQFVDDNGK